MNTVTLRENLTNSKKDMAEITRIGNRITKLLTKDEWTDKEDAEYSKLAKDMRGLCLAVRARMDRVADAAWCKNFTTPGGL